MFIEGYLSDRINSGDYPDYTMKKEELPPTSNNSIEIESSFMLALRNDKSGEQLKGRASV